MHDQSAARNIQVSDSLLHAGPLRDLTIAFEPGQPLPGQFAQQFEIVQTAVPAIESHYCWRKAAFIGAKHHRAKMVVLVQSILRLVVQPKVAWHAAVAVGPHQANQVDALPYGVVLTRPMAAHQRHFTGIRFVQRTIVNDQ